MINFKSYQDGIKDYIETNLMALLEESGMDNFTAYVDDFVDFDKYTQSKVLFYDFGEYTFEALSNESEAEDLEFKVVLAFRGSQNATLKDNALTYAAAFYQMFEASGNNFGGLADYGRIETVNFYNAVEGSKNIKLAELTIFLHTER